MRASIFIPWAASDLSRVSWLKPSILRLARQATISFGERFMIHIHVNGANFDRITTELKHQIPVGIPVLITASPLSGKILAIRHGADVAMEAGSDVLMVVDNDIFLPDGSVEILVNAFRASASEAACATKAPIAADGSSTFQLLYSYAVQESFRHNLFPKRPTGSFYALNPAIVHTILSPGFAEGDLLSKIGANQSGLVVRSPYANDFRSEVNRRVRHSKNSEMNGFFRLHSGFYFASEALATQLPDAVSRARFSESIRLWDRVHRTAQILAVRDFTSCT